MQSPQNNLQPIKPKQHYFSLVLLLIFLGAFGWAFLNQRAVLDWIKLRDYDAPPAISSIADQTTMNDLGRRVFYVNQPQLEDKTDFSNFCPNNGGEETIVLGCYHSNQRGIYLLDVADARLDGVEQVTAAHEMLHAAYDRLSPTDRKNVDNLLLEYYNNELKDQRIKTTIDAYRKTEPNDVVNEMHSIFGSEIIVLPRALEDYYARYFTNRAKVAGFASKYQSEFSSRQDAVAKYDAQLEARKAQIDQLEAELKVQQATISTKQRSLNALKASGDLDLYNAGVPGFNALVDSYNAQLIRLRSLVSQYNSMVAARNAIALEADQLSKELTSTSKPINN